MPLRCGKPVHAEAGDCRYRLPKHCNPNPSPPAPAATLPADTILLLTPSAAHVITSSKKASFLQPLVAGCEAGAGVSLHLHVKDKSEDGSAQIATLLEAARATGDGCASGCTHGCNFAVRCSRLQAWARLFATMTPAGYDVDAVCTLRLRLTLMAHRLISPLHPPRVSNGFNPVSPSPPAPQPAAAGPPVQGQARRQAARAVAGARGGVGPADRRHVGRRVARAVGQGQRRGYERQEGVAARGQGAALAARRNKRVGFEPC